TVLDVKPNCRPAGRTPWRSANSSTTRRCCTLSRYCFGTPTSRIAFDNSLSISLLSRHRATRRQTRGLLKRLLHPVLPEGETRTVHCSGSGDMSAPREKGLLSRLSALLSRLSARRPVHAARTVLRRASR